MELIAEDDLVKKMKRYMLKSPIFGAYIFVLRAALTDQLHIYTFAIHLHAVRAQHRFQFSIIQLKLRRVQSLEFRHEPTLKQSMHLIQVKQRQFFHASI